MSYLNMFETYLQRWSAKVAGSPFSTHTSDLLPVRLSGHLEGHPAMIKITRNIDEQIGGKVLQWWGGKGAARVYAYDEINGAILMERATGSRNLLRMALEDEDDAATSTICHTIHQLHVKRSLAPPEHLLSLKHFFSSLAAMAQREGGIMAQCSMVADELLNGQREHVVLHGDAHHGNILDSGERGWLAIDPKRVSGERYYDYANVLCNPDLKTCIDPMRFARQLEIVIYVAGLDRQRLLKWVMAQAGLSAAWFLECGEHVKAEKQLNVAHLAQLALG